MYKCSLCQNKQKSKLVKGLCQSCYNYFYRNNYIVFEKSKYAELSRVTDKNSNQYDMCICHICGRAYTKLQQHIYHTHNMSKNEYCDKFGLDRSINMTTKDYHNKMSNYAYENNMDNQLIQAGKNTRFKKGHNTSKYQRSAQTKIRLSELGTVLGTTYGKKLNNH